MPHLSHSIAPPADAAHLHHTVTALAIAVSVRLGDYDGWDLLVTRDGHTLASEHYSDWHRVERRRAWLELDLVRAAGRIWLALVILVAIGAVPAAAQKADAGLFPEPRAIEQAIGLVDQLKGGDTDVAADGFYPELGHMIAGAGWISFGPGYRHRLFTGRAVVDASTAISWRGYKIAQARFELPSLADGHLTLGSQFLWKDYTQVSYFGSGAASAESERSDYRIQASNAVVYATVRSNRVLSMTTRVGWLSRPGISSSTGFFDRDLPDTLQQFAQEPGADLARQPAFIHGDVSLIADTRDHAGHPSGGGLYRAGWAGFRDRHYGTFTFERYELEAAQFVPLLGGRSVVALHGLAVFSTPADGRTVPFYLLPGIGGNNTLRGYADYRFHDRHALVLNAESRWALTAHLDGAVFADAGNVGSRVADLDLARTSYGAGVRLHTGRSTIARFEAARSPEGWRLLLRMNDPLRLARLARRTAAMPFAP
jgi:hypothetical protein